MDDIVHKLIKRFKTNDPFRIAAGLNIIIRFTHFEDGTRGLYFRTMRRRFIVIHDDMSEPIQRFVCAHEIGHDRIHTGMNRFWLDEHSFFNVGKYEAQANKFAVKLLTHNVVPELGESREAYLIRCSVPTELHKYFL